MAVILARWAWATWDSDPGILMLPGNISPIMQRASGVPQLNVAMALEEELLLAVEVAPFSEQERESFSGLASPPARSAERFAEARWVAAPFLH